MTIPVLPLTLVSSLERRLVTSVAEARSPFTGTSQIQDWGASWWEYQIEMAVTQGAKARRLSAFPLFEILNHLLGQFSFGRHFECFMPQRLEKQACLTVPGHDRRTGISASQQPRSGIHHQSGLNWRTLGGVALVAVLYQHRTNSRLKEFQLLRLFRSSFVGRQTRWKYQMTKQHQPAEMTDRMAM